MSTALLSCMLLGCGDDDDSGSPDAGADSGLAGHGGGGGSGGSQAQHDAGTDAGHHTGHDAGHPSDAGHDSGSDSGPALDSGVDAGHDSGTKTGLGDPPACEPCEEHLTGACSGARASALESTKTAAHGTKAGAPFSLLTSELLSCIWRTGCAATGFNSDCFCGTGVDTAECFGVRTYEDATGACKDEVTAAAESNVLSDISNRYYDLSYALGLAIAVVECDSTCGFECGFCTPAPGSGPEGDAACHPNDWETDGGA